MLMKKYFSAGVLLLSFGFGTIFSSESGCSSADWEASVQERYQAKETDNYRIFDETTPEHVKTFYRLNHTNQTLDFVLSKKKEFLGLNRQKMSIWEAIEQLNLLVDESDPDIDLPQCYHLYQTAEALRRDGHPRWLILAGFIHDLGKILATYGEPQWAVVGDTFPVGCAYSEKIVFPAYFEANADFKVDLYQTPLGIYSPNCGFDHLHMSWGHDEYLYQVVKDYLPPEAAYIVRFHSFYAAHREGGYEYLMNDKDRKMMPWLKLFSQYDLYSKSSEKIDIDALKPFYQALVNEYFSGQLAW